MQSRLVPDSYVDLTRLIVPKSPNLGMCTWQDDSLPSITPSVCTLSSVSRGGGELVLRPFAKPMVGNSHTEGLIWV